MYDKRLDTFIHVADCGSFTKAADEIYVSTPAVIKQMNQLEKQIGVQLFMRTPQGVTLTDAGQFFYLKAKRFIKTSSDYIEQTRKLARSDKYSIRLGNSLLCPYKLFMEIWNRGGEDCSRFKLSIVPFQDDREAFTSLLANLGQDIDVIAASGDSYLWESKCAFYKLAEKPVTISVPRDHRLAGKERLDIKDLSGERLLVIRRGHSDCIDAIRNYLESEHKDIMIEDGPLYYDVETFNYCEETGIPLLSFDYWNDVHPSFISKPVNWSFTAPYGVLCPTNLTESITRFLEVLGGIAGELNSKAMQ